MKPEVSVVLTKGHRIKQVYGCMSQYSSACDLITNVTHLLQWRSIKHTTPQHAHKMLNDKNDNPYAITQHRGAFELLELLLIIIKYYVFWVYACSFSYPACTVHFCLWPIWLYHIFSEYIINQTARKHVSWTSLQICLNNNYSSKNSGWYYHKWKQTFLYSVAILVRIQRDLNFLNKFSKSN